MKREDLKALELADDVIDKIMAIHGKDIEAHKTALETAKTEIAGLKTQVKDANTAIEGFKALKVEDIQKAADDWKAKAEKAESDGKAQVEQLKFDHALDGALAAAKAKNVTAVKALLKVGDLKLTDEGKVLGLDDQLKALKEANDFLFDGDKPAPAIVAGAQPGMSTADPLWAAMLQGSGLTEPKK